ncbi:MAG TPA: tyrosine-protein phosphatase [Micromonosporaceae bacterium]|nr:tyrosine-protein phosphatase [Micromonosporaceae bacterium]
MTAATSSGSSDDALASREFDGLVNFRDLGGIPVRGGAIRTATLFRSDSLSYASVADAAYLTDDLGVATIVDLRADAEVAEFGRGPLESAPVAYVSLPVVDGPTVDTRSDFYFQMLGANGEALADLVRRLSTPAVLPAIVHCHIGCDRTGAVSAMLLGLAGADDDAICVDYARSSRANDAIRERAIERRRSLGLPIKDRAYYDAWDPRPEIMAATLSLVAREWGDMAGWARTYGLTDVEVAAFRNAIVDPNSSTEAT